MTRHFVGLGALLVVGIVLPFIFPAYLSLGITLLLFAGWATSWDILGGWTGQVSLGHAAFVGIGAYAVALGVGRFGLAPWWGALLGMAVSGVLAFLGGAASPLACAGLILCSRASPSPKSCGSSPSTSAGSPGARRACFSPPCPNLLV